MLEARLSRAWLRHPLVAFVRHRKLITFYSQLHSLIRAGVALPTAFTQLVQFAPDPMMEKGLSAVARDIRGGSTLGEAMQRHSALFDDANVELIAFAEEAGRLEPIVKGVVEHLEKVQKQRWQALIGALWPMYLAAGFVFVGPLLGVAQQITPSGSVGSMYLSGLASSLGTAVLVLSVVLGAPFFIAAIDKEAEWDRVKRRIPLFSAPMRQLAASRLVLGLGLATASGMEAVRSLKVAVKATSSPSLLAEFPKVEAKLRAGGTLTEALGVLEVLDRSSLGSIHVAETTGTLDTELQRMSRELEASSLRATRMLIILVTVVVAGLLLFKIVASMLGVLFGPVKKLYDAAGTGNLDGL
jgi:type II secretory pathway component PulF